ncbi:MAG: hypothetical protein M9945_21420 [Aquamicrobium sp.]|uniref:hypothetical protein n=1 Tax=Aquamicrobium sp. TaxID=1872579 RepID=UPI00349EEBFD|nr:hypothetical protein [Aquamicrobium sp.]
MRRCERHPSKRPNTGQLVIAYGEKFRTPRGYYFVYPADRMTYSSFRSFRAWLLEQAG